MNRSELLALARQCEFSSGFSVDLAEHFTSAEVVEREKNFLTLRAKSCRDRAKTHFAACGVGLMLLIAGLFSLFFVEFSGAMAALLGCMLVFFLATGALTVTCFEAADSAIATLQCLTPLASAAGCKQALEYIQAGQPAVRAWRDLAIAERGVLYEFDVVVMRDLHFGAIARDKVLAAQREDQEACRQLYGIA